MVLLIKSSHGKKSSRKKVLMTKMQQHFFVGDHFSDYFRVPNFCIENVAPDNLVRGPGGKQKLEAIVILHPGPKLLLSANAPMIPCKFYQRKDLNFQGLLYFLYVRTPSWHGLTSKIDFYPPTDLNKFGLDLVVLQGSFAGRQKLNDGLDVRVKIVRTEKNRKCQSWRGTVVLRSLMRKTFLKLPKICFNGTKKRCIKLIDQRYFNSILGSHLSPSPNKVWFIYIIDCDGNCRMKDAFSDE